MTPTTIPPIPATERARALLTPRLASIQSEAISQAETLAQSFTSLSPSQVRGLANALGPGPQRRSGPQRLNELARFLAWRAHRSQDDNSPWSRLARELQENISRLESRCRAEVSRLRDNEQTYWQSHAQDLKAVQAWMELEAIETFIYALERKTTAQQAQERS